MLGLGASRFDPGLVAHRLIDIKISLKEKFGLITEHWRPKVVAELNGQEVKI